MIKIPRKAKKHKSTVKPDVDKAVIEDNRGEGVSHEAQTTEADNTEDYKSDGGRLAQESSDNSIEVVSDNFIHNEGVSDNLEHERDTIQDNDGVGESKKVRNRVLEASESDNLDDDTVFRGQVDRETTSVGEGNRGIEVRETILDETRPESDNLDDDDVDKIRKGLFIEPEQTEEGGILRTDVYGSDKLTDDEAERGYGEESVGGDVHNGVSMEAVNEDEEDEEGSDKLEDGDEGGRGDGGVHGGLHVQAGQVLEEDDQTGSAEIRDKVGESNSIDDDSLRDSDNSTTLTEEELENIVDANSSDNSIEEEQVIEDVIEPGIEPKVEKSDNSNLYKEISEERKYQKKLSVINFLVEYCKAISRSVDEVSHKMNISTKTGRDYLNEYINTVKQSVINQTYPMDVLHFYNQGITDDDKRLKFWHTEQLRELVKRYSKYDINASLDPNRNKTLNNEANDTFISKNRVVSPDDNLSLLSNSNQPQSQPQQQQQLVQPSFQDQYNDIDTIHDGITSLQLIRFGLARVFGQQARTKIGDMIGQNVTPYLMDEQKLHHILRLFSISETRIADFIEWLKNNAKYVSHPEGFLAYGANPNSSGVNIAANGIPHQSNYTIPNGVGSQDLMTDFYYKKGVYDPAFPPNHPINQEALREYKQTEQENKQMKSLDQKINMYVRTKMLDAFDGSGKNGQGNSLFSPEMMMMMGMAEYRQVKDENGNVTWVLTPKMLGGPPGMGTGGIAASPTDTMTGMMAMMKEMMGFMASMQKSNTDPTQQSFMSTVMTALASKLTEQPQNRIQEVVSIADMLQKLKGPENIGANMGAITDPDVIIKTKRMDLDKEFGMRRLDLQEKELQLQRDRLQMQDKEANQNLQTLLEGIQSFAPMVVNMVQQFIMGNKGSAGAVAGQPGGVMPQQGQAPPQQNPADLILKMEYQKQQQRMAEERERKQREWEEDQRRRRAEEQMYNQPPPPPPQPKPEVERVIIKEVPVKTESRQKVEEEAYDEATFNPFSPQELELALENANKQMRKLEAYKATVGTVLQNKLLNGDSSADIIEVEQQQPVIQQKQKQEPVYKDVGEMLDNYPRGSYDPDYDGVEREEEVEIVTDDDEHANIVSDTDDRNEAEDVEI